MNPQEVLLISQLAALVAQGVTQLIATRKSLAANATASEQANLDKAHANFQSVIDTASKISA